MLQLRLQELTDQELTAVYETDLTRDFQPDELKPLAMIQDVIRRGEYVACGIYEDCTRVGYAFFLQLPGMQLLDYFAIQPELRGTGIGTAFLHMLAESCGTDCVLLETEDPDHIADENAKRRLHFYLRSGAGTRESVLKYGVLRIGCFCFPETPSIRKRSMRHCTGICSRRISIRRKSVLGQSPNKTAEQLHAAPP